MTSPETSEWPEARTRIEAALADLRAGRPVVVTDDHDRENEGDLILAAETATAEQMAFVVRHTSGVLCVPAPGEVLDRLALPPMTAVNEDPKGTAFAVSVDARTGVTTGISAADRTRTVRLLADPTTSQSDLTRPGHLFPLRAADGGVLTRRGHTEAAVDLARMAGLAPVGVLAELVADSGEMLRYDDCRRFADEHSLAFLTIAELAAHRRRTETLVERGADVELPTTAGRFRAVGYRVRHSAVEPVALVYGDVGAGEDVLVRIHSDCFTGDVLGSLRCDCGQQLADALSAVAAEGRGVVVYLRGQEGRGIGLADKLRAYELQERGADTVDANLALGLPVDARDYTPAAQVLTDLGVRSVRLLSGNPAKAAVLEECGVDVLAVRPLPAAVTPDNVHYLRTKRDRLGHDVPGLPYLLAVGENPGTEVAGDPDEGLRTSGWST